jgi:hypothetical protein
MPTMNRKALWLALSLAVPTVAGGLTLASTTFADEPPARHAAATVAPSTVDGRFQRYLVGPRGHIAGILLQDGAVVWMPPQSVLSGAPVLKAGDPIHIEGQVHATATGSVINRALVQSGSNLVADARQWKHPEREEGKKHEKGAKLGALTSSGSIVALLSNPKGRVEGVVLDDGTTALAGHHEKLGDLGLKVGQKVTVTGRGGVYEKGKGMRIVSVTLPSGETKVLEQGKRDAKKGPLAQTPVVQRPAA